MFLWASCCKTNHLPSIWCVPRHETAEASAELKKKEECERLQVKYLGAMWILLFTPTVVLMPKFVDIPAAQKFAFLVGAKMNETEQGISVTGFRHVRAARPPARSPIRRLITFRLLAADGVAGECEIDAAAITNLISNECGFSAFPY